MSVHFILHSRTTMSPKTLNTSEFSILTAFFGGSSAMTCHQLSSFITGGLWWIDLQSDFDGFLQFHQVVKPWNPTIPIPSCSPPLLLFSVQKCLQGVHFRGQVSRSTTWMMHGWSSGFCSNGSQPLIVHGKTERLRCVHVHGRNHHSPPLSLLIICYGDIPHGEVILKVDPTAYLTAFFVWKLDSSVSTRVQFCSTNFCPSNLLTTQLLQRAGWQCWTFWGFSCSCWCCAPCSDIALDIFLGQKQWTGKFEINIHCMYIWATNR